MLFIVRLLHNKLSTQQSKIITTVERSELVTGRVHLVGSAVIGIYSIYIYLYVKMFSAGAEFVLLIA